jgi:hypothetical protein
MGWHRCAVVGRSMGSASEFHDRRSSWDDAKVPLRASLRIKILLRLIPRGLRHVVWESMYRILRRTPCGESPWWIAFNRGLRFAN